MNKLGEIMKSHDESKDLLIRFVLGQLSEKEASEITRHLVECEECSVEIKKLGMILECARQTEDLSADEVLCKSAKKAILSAADEVEKTGPKPTVHMRDLLRNVMQTRITKLVAAAVIAIIVLGGVTFWPAGPNGEWWVGPSAAVAREIMAQLDKVAAMTYRQQGFRVRDYGPDTMGTLWEKRYAAKDRYRSDVYDDSNNVVIMQWTLPDGEGFAKYKVWIEYQCYTKKPEKSPPFYDNVMSSLRRWVSFLDRAERILGTISLEGRECVGFEVSPGTYGNFFVGEPFHIWFDVKTKLPVRIERYGLETSYEPGSTLTLIHDQFDYYAEVPADMFTLHIPEGFINAEPDEIIAARKGEMVFADVPEELRDEIVSALKEVQTVVYQEHLEWTTADGETHTYGPRNMYLARDSWREDGHKWETPRKTKWYVIEKEGRKEINHDFSNQNFRLIETIVNFTDETYSVATYKETSRHQHPMDRILFLAALVNRADRILENTEIEGTECFGFEISTSKYGNNQSNDKHRMWFDTETKLPVRMEFEYWKPDGKSKSVRIRDHFQWDPELDEKVLVPIIPEGFELIEASEK